MSHELRTPKTHKLLLRTANAAEAYKYYQTALAQGLGLVWYQTPLKRKG